MTTTTDTTALAELHDNFGMFTHAGGLEVASLVQQLQERGITHARGEVLHEDALAGLDRIAEMHGEATDTAVREAVAYAIAEPAAPAPTTYTVEVQDPRHEHYMDGPFYPVLTTTDREVAQRRAKELRDSGHYRFHPEVDRPGEPQWGQGESDAVIVSYTDERGEREYL